MRQHREEVAAIASQPAPPTFENTLVALERSGDLLTRVLRVFGALASANTNDTLQTLQTDIAPELAAHLDSMYLDASLFERVSQIYSARDDLVLSPEQCMLVERYHLDFVRAGARLDEAGKARLRELNQEESTLIADFGNRLLAATKQGALVVDDRSELAGLNEADLAAAAAAANGRGHAGSWVLPLHNTTQQPDLTVLRRRGTRRRLFETSIHRADQGDASDTGSIIQRLAQLRAERASLLGYPSFAAFALDDQMARTPDAAIRLLTDIAEPATARARREAARIQMVIDGESDPFSLEPWDWQYYAERVRQAEYDLDESQLRPYFQLERVVRDGLFYMAEQLYGITFVERTDLPVYHPEVRVFEIHDADGSSLALFYCDYFNRDNKRGGAWMDSFVDQSRLLGTRPVIYNVANFTKPAPGQFALLSFDDVNTMFHEFGHVLHGIFADVEYPMLSGTNVPRDFVEFPSQLHEHWALDPTVFANYARHHQTGAPMPQVLVDRIKKSQTFNQGFALTEYLAAALIDMAWHTLAPETALQDPDTLQQATLTRYGMNIRAVPPRYMSTYFSHIWGGGYSAGYYAYLWAEVLDHDTFAWIREHGGLTRANGQRLRDMILSRGGTEDAAALYRAFRGRDPSVAPLLEERGLAPSISPA